MMISSFSVFLTLVLVVYSKEVVDQLCLAENNKNATFNVVALILARGGSKGVPRKNLAKIDGISLLGRTLKVLTETKLFPEVYVSTEDSEIALEALKYGAIVHTRPQHLARDDSSSIDAVQDFISVHKHYNKIALFQCTSVFLNQSYVLQAFKLFQTKQCVFSATRSFKLRWKIDENGSTIPLNFDPKSRLRRQDWAGELVENGMLYFADRVLIEKGLFQNNRCGVIEILPEDSLEIDTITDLNVAECLLSNN